MKINEPVRIYEGEWYSEGRITDITRNSVRVDFVDWVQEYTIDSLQADYVFYKKVWIPTVSGTTIVDYRI